MGILLRQNISLLLIFLSLLSTTISEGRIRGRILLEQQKQLVNNQTSRMLKEDNTITRVWDVCPENFPPLHAILHERNKDLRDHYESEMGNQIYRFNGYKWGVAKDTIRFQTIKNGKFALYTEDEQYHYWTGQGSAWNDDGDMILSEGQYYSEDTQAPLGTLVPPLVDTWNEKRTVIKLTGDYVVYTGWMYGNLGHFIHDNLPNIAYLKSLFPKTTRFLLGHDKLHERILKFIDPEFTKDRVMWFSKEEHVISVEDGTLTASVLNSPNYMGCCEQFDPLRQWMATAHPEIPEKKIVIFYTRGNKDTGERNEDNKHGRVLNREKEKLVLQHLDEKLKQYNRDEEIVIFDGQENGETMSIENQFALFRSASIIIGPHGSGLGGNYVWTNPNPKSCDERVQILEFLPGKESAHVQALHASYFMHYRKWPFEYHQILYTKESTRMVTDINIDDFDDALDAMLGPNRIRSVDYENSSAWEPETSMETYLEQVHTAKVSNIDHRIKQ